MSSAVTYLKQFNTDLKNPSEFSPISFQVKGVLNSGSPDDCVELASYLADLVAKNGKNLEELHPDLYLGYWKMWGALMIKGFHGISTNDQSSLLQKRVLTLLKNGHDLDEIVQSYFDLGFSLSKIQTIFRTFAAALEQNSETIGNLPIQIEGVKYLPAIKYWILDYSKFPSKSAKRTNVDRLNYINSSANVRQLTQIQRQWLMQILKLYDNFINPEPPIQKIRPEEADQRKNSIIADQTEKEIPKQIPEVPTLPTVPLAPVAPAAPELPKIDIDQKLNELKNRQQK